MNTLLKLSFIAVIALVITSCGSDEPIQAASYRPEQVTERLNQSESEKTIVKEDPAISKDSIKREWEREIEQEREGYAKEQARFAKVLSEASDEELFVVLNYAIANHYVPNRDIDPFFSTGVMVGCWQRTLMVYRNLSDSNT